uniref:Uncharacterized protein n=1 Tax=Globisporangium ultimum (strain ATCC 200006 / CBS 805.95 / DAOM BR144) TaxID=431595 RepID=K3WEC2_GLOUD
MRTGVNAAEDSLYDDAKACELRHAPPAKNVQPLRFCNWYRHKSCCLPAHDAEIKGYFLALIEAGETCAKYQNRAKYFLSLVFCYGCDPDEPNHFNEPINTEFYNASSKTLKLCASVTSEMTPAAFSDCGLLLADDRDTICSPNSAVAPEYVWPGCDDQQYICQNQATSEWYCSDTNCGDGQTPVGFMDAPCNATEQTCTGVHMFVNDQRAAKPVQYEAYAVEIVDETQCMVQYNNATKCNCLRAPASGCTRGQHLDFVLLVMVFALLTAFGAW